MPETKSWYMLFGVGIFAGNLLVDLIDERHLTVRMVTKAAVAALIAVGVLVWWSRRKGARDAAGAPDRRP
jgi:predicted MFS family arabinose efflux permease